MQRGRDLPQYFIWNLRLVMTMKLPLFHKCIVCLGSLLGAIIFIIFNCNDFAL